MEGIINLLKNMQNVIQKGLNNFKKSPKERITLEYVETRTELLEQDWNKFKDINSKIYEKYDTEQIGQSLMDIYDTTEDSYITYKSLLKTSFNKLTVKQSTQDKASDNPSKRTSNTFVKLPKITIPTFSGRYSEWVTFKDLFIGLVHKNEALDDCQRLHYLKNHLTGEAEQLIRHTPISEANYAQCWSVLEKRYDNKKYQANCILNRLFGQKRMNVECGFVLKELLDTTNDCLNALQNLNVDVTTWDIIIIYIVVDKLDLETRKQWELSVSPSDSNELPTLEQFRLFLETRYRALELIEPKRALVHQGNRTRAHNTRSMLVTNSSAIRCEYCTEFHKLCFCKKFANQSVRVRREFVTKNKICFNCLGSNHIQYNCKAPTSCKICKRRHHSLLHIDEGSNSRDTEVLPTGSNCQPTYSGACDKPVVSCLSTGAVPNRRQILLATALVRAEARLGNYQLVRALLDQGSQASFITEATVQLLNLTKIPVRGIITGLGNSRTTIARHMVQLAIQSRVDSNVKLQFDAYVLGKITSYLPEQTVSLSGFDWIDSSLCLADPEFNMSNKIDVLLGADAYSSIMKEGIVKSPSGTLIAQNTFLGWILSGVMYATNDLRRTNISVMHAQIKEDELLKKFWEIEEQTSSKRIFTPEEEKCEKLYEATTRRNKEGRYVVELPFRDLDPPCKGGNSREIAEARFKSLEKRLEKNSDLKKEYSKVMQEYLDLGHMRLVTQKDDKKQVAVYLPHHAVIRNDKTTTKVRVVFNASERNRKGVSLNDTLMVGPTLQSDLRHTVTAWRRHAIALVADIVKMYRQIRISDEDTIYQRILWRDNSETAIRDYELLTVTFGTASAPYQAVRTLHQVAYDEGHKYPLAVDRVLNDFFMDDLMTGCDSVEEGIRIYTQITKLLGEAGFILQKWNSNEQDMLEAINSVGKCKVTEQTNKDARANMENKNVEVDSTDMQGQTRIEIKFDSTVKILGLVWNRSEDKFQYLVTFPCDMGNSVTKRAVISDIARLFDPLGWLAPSIVLAKIFIQKLWLAGLDWDEALGTELVEEWHRYRMELGLLSQIQIPRWLGTRPNDELELHGFSDASKVAYSAVIYLRIKDITGHIHVSLVVAKTRVAPIKQVSIPRLELCGAVLLARLLLETSEVLKVPREKIVAWTDSTVVLAWLNSHPSRWKTFVANRTSEILTTMTSAQWFHVSSTNNPADCASRGMLPNLLIEHQMWFQGPSFLKRKEIEYNRPKDLNSTLEESIKTHLSIVPDSMLDRFSSLSRLLRVVSYCRRFLNKGKNQEIYLQKKELQEALNTCIRKVQKETFTKEYEQIKEKNYLLAKTSKLKVLCPYLDSADIMRVRGRLEKSQLDEQTKHPIILPKDAHFTHLIVSDAHIRTLHGGPQLMLNYLRTAYWIIGAKELVKHHVRKCVTCAKQRASCKTPFMGSLPSVRCTPAQAFLAQWCGLRWSNKYKNIQRTRT